MAASHKILTVSYGTFSCTLEGFDDAFETMKAIAEYFRDLAADDRYFGAEPPTPDAEMLARIAEREVARRVEARMDATGIVLRAAETLAPAAAPPVAFAAEPPATAAEPLATLAAEPPAALAAEPSVPPAPPEADIAAKLERIRAVVGRQPAQVAAAAAAARPEAALHGEEPREEPDDLVARFDPDEIEARAPAPDAPATQEDRGPLAPTGADEDGADEDGAETMRLEAGSAEEGRQPVRPRVVRMRRSEFEQALAAGAVMADAEPEPRAAASGLSPEEEAELLAELAAVEAGVAEAPESRPPESRPPESRPPESAARVIAAEPGPAPAWDEDDDGASVRVAVSGMMAGVAEAEPAAPLREATAALPESGRLSDILVEVIDLEPVSRGEPVAAAEAELAPMPRAAILTEGVPDRDEAGMSRLLSHTDARLADPESVRRREAIAQLKAAVAATEAARQAGDALSDGGERSGPFREDLRQAVRPRRPTAQIEGPRSERPRPAPLKLVASQRVDLDPSEPEPTPTVAAIRPRRVTAAGATHGATHGAASPAPQAAASRPAATASFAAFAAEMGAHSLTDILEAAAAYTAFVEGAEDFSRPHILGKVREATAADFSREEGLRSFGTLLREGRILRVRGGRFQVSDETRFHPGRARAG